MESVSKVQNPNYLFINLNLDENVQAGIFEIQFKQGQKTINTYNYELKAREKDSQKRTGFNSSDVIYLITPDRFVIGNPQNHWVEGMKEKPIEKTGTEDTAEIFAESLIRSIICRNWDLLQFG